MNVTEAISYIEATHKFGTRLGLESMRLLLGVMDNPQDKLKFIHIAGTNGKGSTATMIATILKTAGYKTGLFTSPFLEAFNERIQLNNAPIDDDSLVSATLFVKQRIEILLEQGEPHPTEFEMVTAVGLQYFYQQQVDVVVLEVGLGGRLDATNIINDPLAVVIMGVSYDHTDYLGNTLAEIAFEKAAIIKEGSDVIVYPQDPEALTVILDFGAAKNAKMVLVNPDDISILSHTTDNQTLKYRGDHLYLDGFCLKLLGDHQALNCLTALEVMALLNRKGYTISASDIKKALATVVFPGRFEIFLKNPVVLIDGAHNSNGIQAFVSNINQYFANRTINLFFGMLEDKDIEESLSYLVPIASTIHTLTPNSDRAMPAEKMAALIHTNYGKSVDFYDTMEAAVKSIDLTRKDEVNVFVGSLYMIGEARTLIRENLL
ncbi:MAG: dihydrofolate synthase / folylpolyglutamate synthase [Acetobacterium sp.]|jgi:dihydrofolate synthase/folylpolyglutamate synthase|uniref:bifunctional folylpolyglutamate synthase/dihydrofolate synthase n=1 Tax=unclassified Acetobacterium TaxID=2638182 RepID=UPI000DBEAFC6|nr:MULTISPECIES: folylpolyglutamate synthase/dihydrofolate synthase family protein [unclassified Acetobacterium]AWW26813.1 bifunctional folylpolyglutamate synthase/dihydrofolate synthase [Acetobacterium sp. KB-1]MDK2943099.1 dihydrofolate synthase / folylpolyglutamate synthase [Acetobacterium sp.]MDZ5725188.1 folylpolyglutamate synthase/dihydrofolate synthase family protein [Acetobacterium sp. K1/6]